MRDNRVEARLPGAILFFNALIYGLCNFGCVWLAVTGIVHPPWGILTFLTFVGPILITLPLALFQTLACILEKPRFDWRHLATYVASGLIAGILNYWLLVEASAAV